MMTPVQAFETYVASLGRLTPHVDPTLVTPETEQAFHNLEEEPAGTSAALGEQVVNLLQLPLAALPPRGDHTPRGRAAHMSVC